MLHSEKNLWCTYSRLHKTIHLTLVKLFINICWLFINSCQRHLVNLPALLPMNLVPILTSQHWTSGCSCLRSVLSSGSTCRAVRCPALSRTSCSVVPPPLGSPASRAELSEEKMCKIRNGILTGLNHWRFVAPRMSESGFFVWIRSDWGQLVPPSQKIHSKRLKIIK